MAPATGGDSTLTRRSLLTGLTAGAAATSGCLSRLRTMVGRQEPRTVTLSIKTLPVDEDPFAIATARQLATWFEAAGIRTSVEPMTAKELFQQVLINHDFGVFVGQFPGRITDPDGLYELLHSTYSVEPGLQNPFGYTNLLMDDLLERQRQERGATRAATATTVQRQLTNVAPFSVLGFPSTLRAARTDQFAGWNAAFDPSPVNLLGLNRVDDAATTLRATTPDSRPMANLNPLMPSYRGTTDVTDLLYDSLARRYQGTLYPWAAAEWTWTGTDPPELEVTLREEMLFHDGESLSADDVAYTYDLLADTSLGTLDQTVPTMRFRGQSSLVEETTVLDDNTVQMVFAETTQSVAQRALTVPLLPEHVWRDRTDRAQFSGVDVGATTTEALVTDAIPPVGSGPLVFDSATQRQQLALERYEDHFLQRDEETGLPSSLASGAPFERFELRFVGSDAASVDLLANGEADVTFHGVGPDLVSRIGETPGLSLQITRAPSFYLAGFNTRRSPLTNPRFRDLLTQLIDRATLSASVFDGYLDPAVSPLAGTQWLPTELAWSAEDPITDFLGSNGTVDGERARSAFRSAGYRYNEQGRLIR